MGYDCDPKQCFSRSVGDCAAAYTANHFGTELEQPSADIKEGSRLIRTAFN